MSFFKPSRINDAKTIYKELRNQLNKAKLRLGNVEVVDFTPELRFNQRTIGLFTKYSNEVQKFVVDPALKVFQLPYEPDGDKLVLWYMCREYGSFGNILKDDSGFGNDARVFGNGGKTTGHVRGLEAITTDGTNQYIRTVDNGWININGGSVPALPGSNTTSVAATTSISIQLWIKPRSITLTSSTNNRPRILAYKIDARSGNTITRGWSIWVEQDGTVWFAYRHTGTNTYARAFTKAIKRLDNWYFISATLSIGTPSTPNLYVNGVASSTSAIVTNRPPQFPTTISSGTDLFFAGTDESSGIAKVSGSTGDMRFWRNKVLTASEILNQWNNKYTILNITDVARANGAYVAVEGVEGGSQEPGQQPNPPPDPTQAFSFSAFSFTPESVTIDESNQAAPGGMGISGGSGGVDPAIPSQLMDAFNPITHYTLTSLNQTSPNSKWKLIALPGTNGYVRTESYTHIGESEPSTILRMKHGTTAPILQFNLVKFAEFYARYRIRTISQNITGDLNRGQLLFKYVDASNYYYLTLTSNNISVRKVVNGTDTSVATGPTRTGAFTVGSLHTVELYVREDGAIIDVIVDDDAAATRLTINSTNNTIPDSVVSSVSAMAFRANNCDMMVSDIMVRPLLSDGWESGSPWSLTSAGTNTPNGKWQLQTAPGTGGFCQSTTSGGGTYGHVLRLRYGTAAPMLLSRTTFTNLLMEWEMKTTSVLVADNYNRARAIFKYKDASNFYYFVAFPTGWEIHRVQGGVAEVRVKSTANGLADNNAFTAGRYKILVTNSGRDFEVWKGTSVLLYKEESGRITLNATGNNINESVQEDDNGILAEAGKVGFYTHQCDALIGWVNVIAS